jgi:L-threonylcarbamoyladenylate synthase
LTLVLPKRPELPEIVTSGLPTVAVRQSANPVFRAVGKALGSPLAAPSANRFGRISPTSAAAVAAELGGRIPLIIDGGACREGLESTIVEVVAAPVRPLLRVLRAGPVTREQLRAFGKVVAAPRICGAPAAPGQLASHYAPRTPLRLFARPEEFHPAPDRRYGLLSYRGAGKDGWIDAHPWAAVEVLSPGGGKLAEAAVRLFHALRRLDNAGLDEIVAEPVAEVGLGVAIMDRLRRAAATPV